MNAEQYISKEKNKFKTANQWAKNEIKEHKKRFENNDIEEINQDYINELKACTSWGEALEIAKNFII